MAQTKLHYGKAHPSMLNNWWNSTIGHPALLAGSSANQQVSSPQKSLLLLYLQGDTTANLVLGAS